LNSAISNQRTMKSLSVLFCTFEQNKGMMQGLSLSYWMKWRAYGHD